MIQQYYCREKLHAVTLTLTNGSEEKSPQDLGFKAQSVN